MANVNAPYGFVPVRHKSGAEVQTNTNGQYTIAPAYGTAIYYGDVVERTGTGNNISKAAAGNTDNIGIFAGCWITRSDGEVEFRKNWDTDSAATSVRALVWDDPGTIFRAQADTLAEGDVGALADHNAGTASTVFNQSGSYVDVGAGTGTSGKSFRILGLVPDDQATYAAYAEVYVEFAEHALIAGGGVGV